MHGDYRIGNLIVSHAAPVQILGVIDWEMATLGDPLADVGYLAANLAERGKPGNVITELQPVTREPGFPDGDALAARYAELTGRSIATLPWYRVLALWKSAIFLEQSYKRFLSGNDQDPSFARWPTEYPSWSRPRAAKPGFNDNGKGLPAGLRRDESGNVRST